MRGGGGGSSERRIHRCSMSAKLEMACVCASGGERAREARIGSDVSEAVEAFCVARAVRLVKSMRPPRVRYIELTDVLYIRILCAFSLVYIRRVYV